MFLRKHTVQDDDEKMVEISDPDAKFLNQKMGRRWKCLMGGESKICTSNVEMLLKDVHKVPIK